MTDSENRLLALEQYVYYTEARLLRSMQQQLANLNNDANQGGMPGGSGGSSGAFYACYPTANVSPANWSGGVPLAGNNFTATVYRCAYGVTGGTITDLGTQDCVNWLPTTLGANLACICVLDEVGAYGVVSQSCT